MLSLALAYPFLALWFLSIGGSINKAIFKSTLSLFDSLLLGVSFMSLMILAISLVTPLDSTTSFSIIISTLLIGTTYSYQNLRIAVKEVVAKLHKTDVVWISIGFILVALYSSSPPLFIDNDSYYLPTIKWMQEYGAVPGLGNLHYHLSLFSAWHALEALTQVLFGFSNLFALNGFLLFSFWCTAVLNRQHENRIAVLSLCMPLLLLFTGMSAPDLPVILIGFHLLIQFVRKRVNLCYATIISTCLILIKPTLILLPIFFLIYWIVDKKLSEKRELMGTSVIILFALVTFFSRNIILTGHIFFPVISPMTELDWVIPNEMINTFHAIIEREFWGEVSDSSKFSLSSLVALIIHGGVASTIYVLTLLLLISFPVLGLFDRIEKRDWHAYIFVFISSIFLFLLWPAPRFFIPFLLFFGALFIKTITDKIQWVGSNLLIVGITLSILPLVFLSQGVGISSAPMQENAESKNYSPSILSRPSATVLNYSYSSSTKGNLSYYHPLDSTTFWLSIGEAPLPSASHQKIDYFENYLHVTPQMRGTNLSDGFYSKQLNNK
jgi:hypothetical protein